MKTKALLLICLFAGHAWAEDQKFAFALPELEGGISLGVFDSSKKLVRTLAVNAAETDFTIGLNGLIATWDGKNDSGEALPAGKYFVRGYLVGQKVISEGEAFHFNDWVESEEAAFPLRPRVIWASGNNVKLVAEKGPAATGSMVFNYQEANGVQEICGLPETARFSTADGKSAVFDVVKTSALYALEFADPTKSFSFNEGKAIFSSGAIWKGNLYLSPAYGSAETKIKVFKFTNPAEEEGDLEASPERVQLLDANAAALVASDHRLVWVYKNKRFDQVSLGEDVFVTSLSAGVGETFWITGHTNIAGVQGPAFVRQYSFQGELLRQLAGENPTSLVFADKDEERIFLSQSPDAATTVIKGLRPTSGDPNSGTVDWEVFLDKTSVDCAKFGLRDGQLVPDAGDVSGADKVAVDSTELSLQNKTETLNLRVRAVGDQIWLQSKDGLSLLSIGKLSGVQRCVVRKDGKFLQVFAGNGAVVAEYRVAEPSQIVKINAGEIDLP